MLDIRITLLLDTIGDNVYIYIIHRFIERILDFEVPTMATLNMLLVFG